MWELRLRNKLCNIIEERNASKLLFHSLFRIRFRSITEIHSAFGFVAGVLFTTYMELHNLENLACAPIHDISCWCLWSDCLVTQLQATSQPAEILNNLLTGVFSGTQHKGEVKHQELGLMWGLRYLTDAYMQIHLCHNIKNGTQIQPDWLSINLIATQVAMKKQPRHDTIYFKNHYCLLMLNK